MTEPNKYYQIAANQMPPLLALSIVTCIVLFFLKIERNNRQAYSLACLIPTVYLLVCSSRPIGRWITGPSIANEGSVHDRFFLLLIYVLAILVLTNRRKKIVGILSRNSTLIILFLFLGISILWSNHPFISLKRWIRILGAIPVFAIILTEKYPEAVIESIFRKVAYILIPYSIVLIKYFPHLGVGYGRWSGTLMWCGVAITKNALGQLCVVCASFILLSFFRQYSKFKKIPLSLKNQADIFILMLSLYLMFGAPSGAYSATSMGALFIVLFLLLFYYIISNSSVYLVKIFTIFIFCMWPIMYFSEAILATVSESLGRDATLTGRSDVWDLSIQVGMERPIFGTGFGGFFGLDNIISSSFRVGNTAHNGLLDVFIETGIVGILMLLIFLFSYYKRFIKIVLVDRGLSFFGIIILILSLVCNYTESLFLKNSSLLWNLMVLFYICFSQYDSIDLENSQALN